MTIESLQQEIEQLQRWIEILSREPETQTERAILNYIEFESGPKACQACTESGLFLPGKKNPTRNYTPQDIYNLIFDKDADCRKDLRNIAGMIFNNKRAPYQ